MRNYFVLAGSDRPGLDEDLGYASADLMLFAQTLGLNTWWIGGTFSRKNVEQAVPGKKVIGIVAVGFGVTPGVAHKSKTAAEVSSYEGPEPQWFADGVQARASRPDGAQQAMLPDRRRRRQSFHQRKRRHIQRRGHRHREVPLRARRRQRIRLGITCQP